MIAAVAAVVAAERAVAAAAAVVVVVVVVAVVAVVVVVVVVVAVVEEQVWAWNFHGRVTYTAIGMNLASSLVLVSFSDHPVPREMRFAQHWHLERVKGEMEMIALQVLSVVSVAWGSLAGR